MVVTPVDARFMKTAMLKTTTPVLVGMLSTPVIILALLHATGIASSKIEKAPGFIYIASFNVYRLGAVESRYKTVSELNNEIPTRIKNIARVLAVGDFDIIALQEVRAGQSGQAVDSVAEKQIMESPAQTPSSPPEPDKNGRDATVEAESPPRSEVRRESLDNPKKGVNWQLIGIVVAIIGTIVVPVILGWLNYKNSRKTPPEGIEASIEKGIEKGLRKFAENTAGITSKDPDEAAATAARVQREPAASVVDRAHADALRLQREGKFEEAIEKWHAIATIVGEEDRPLQILAWFAIGYLRSEGEGADLEAAKDAYTMAIELNPALAEPYVNRGITKNSLRQYDEAIADYNRAIELNPALAEAYYNRGIAKKALDRHDEAIADYSRAIELNPSDASAYYNRGVVKEALDRHDEAIADYNRAIELNPAHAGVYYNRGNAKNSLRQYEDAIADYSRAIELNPSDARAYNNRGNAKNALGRHEDAIADYSRAIELNPAHAGAYNNRGIVKNILGRHDEAIADYSRAIELNPALAEAYYNRGAAKSEIGRITKRERVFRKRLTWPKRLATRIS